MIRRHRVTNRPTLPGGSELRIVALTARGMRAEHQRAFVAADLSLAEVGESASTPVGARIAALPHEDPGGQDALAGELAKWCPGMIESAGKPPR